ncbi:hypothetical protein AGMMS50268_25760 [Spirochaetia bacterium]|nr:hypothetical protein AGMMS50268_25760 [Spirochaetia bacterium]
MFRLCNIAVILVIFSSCKLLVTFEELSVTTNVPGQRRYLNEEYLCLDFSITPDHESVKRQLKLECENKTISYSPVWDGAKLYIKENPSWKLGKQYKVTLDGSLRMEDGRYYTHSLSEIFYYGEKNNDLTLDLYTPVSGRIIEASEKLHFEFNKPVNISSFQETFTLSPYCTTSMIFSTDKKKVDIQAADGWGINTIYTWQISELLADDGYYLVPSMDGRFFTNAYTELPQVERICAFDKDVYNPLPFGIDGKIQQGSNRLGIIFSKPMDSFSVKNAVSITPAIKGYLQQDPADPKRFVYIPQEFYDVGIRYKLTIASSARDTEGLSFQDTVTAFFSPQNGYLEIKKLIVESGSNIYTKTTFSDIDTINNFTVDRTAPYTVKFSLQFSTALESSEIANMVNKIKVEVHFPATSNSADLTSVDWNVAAPDTVTLVYKNFTLASSSSDFKVYSLKITGGKSGVVDGRGGYMEDDICVYFNML